MAAIVCSLVVTMAALGVDVGAAAFEKRDLQKVVDLAAIDAVHAVTDRRPPAGDVETVEERALRFARESATRNGFDWAATGNSLSILLGTGDSATRQFWELPANADPSIANSVKVIASTGYKFKFAPGDLGLGADGVALGRRSGSTGGGGTGGTGCEDPGGCGDPGCEDPAGCGGGCEDPAQCGGGGCTDPSSCDDGTENDGTAEISVGSRVARVSTTGSPMLNATLTGLGLGPAELDVASYEALAAGDVTLDALWLGLGFGSPDEVLNGEVELGELVDATISALNSDGSGVALAAAAALDALKTSAGGSFDPTLTFSFAEALDVGASAPGSALSGELKVLDLLVAAAEVANGEQLATITVPTGQVPGVASGTIKIGVIEAPQFAVGPARMDAGGSWVTRAQTAQIRIQADLVLEDEVTGLVTGPMYLPVYATLGSATGDLTAIDCNAGIDGDDALVPVTVHAETSAMQASVGAVTDSSLTNPEVPPEVAPGVVAELTTGAKVYGTAEASSPGETEDIVFLGAFDGRVHTVGGAPGIGAGLSATLALDVSEVAGLQQALVEAQVQAALTRTLEVLDATLLSPLGSALGVRFAGADYANPWVDCFEAILIE